MNLNGGNEQEDGHDAVEYLAAQPFCDGNVGMFGLSYFGFTQIAAAAGAPAHLKAICPFMCCSLSSFGTSSMQTVAAFHLNWAIPSCCSTLIHTCRMRNFAAESFPS